MSFHVGNDVLYLLVGIELEKDLNLALITIEPSNAGNRGSISSFRVGSSKIQPSDRWLSLAWKANTSTFQPEECSFKNGTCNRSFQALINTTQEIEGWPIVSKRKKSSWKNTLIVGLLQNTTKNEAILIDNEGLKWIARIVAQSVQIQYLPSCRGPGKNEKVVQLSLSNNFDFPDKESLRLLLQHVQNHQNDAPIRSDVMLSDYDNSLLDKLKLELEQTKHQLENKTRTLDRLLDTLDRRDQKIEDLKKEAERNCESMKVFSLHPNFFNIISVFNLL